MAFNNVTGDRAMAFLRAVLRVNAAFSTLSGMVFVLGGGALAVWLGRDGLVMDGVILLTFAAVLVWITRAPTVSLRAAALVVTVDVIYVIDTGSQIVHGSFTTPGSWFFGVVCVLVADLAALQAFGIFRSSKGADVALVEA